MKVDVANPEVIKKTTTKVTGTKTTTKTKIGLNVRELNNKGRKRNKVKMWLAVTRLDYDRLKKQSQQGVQ